MSRSSGEGSFTDGDRAAVEPIAALVAVVAVGAALGLYTVALDDATPDHDRPTAEATLDRIEPAVTTGGVIEPDRLSDIERFRFATLLELEADGEMWRVRSSDGAPERNQDDGERARTTQETTASDTLRESNAVDVAERTVTVRVGPGQNARGTLRAVVRQ